MCGIFVYWYWFESHSSLVFGMVMRCRPLSSYTWAASNCVWIVLVVVSMSLYGLHSLIDMCDSGIIVAGPGEFTAKILENNVRENIG